MVMLQNEFNSAQVFPSCIWTARGLTKFIQYLGPPMQKLGVDLFLGTMERADEKLADTGVSRRGWKQGSEKIIKIKIAGQIIKPALKANSFNTFVVDKF